MFKMGEFNYRSLVLLFFIMLCHVVPCNTFSQGIITRSAHPKTQTRASKKVDTQSDKNNASNMKLSKPSGYVNGYEAIDLGLSVRWASCNVRALSHSDFGGHYTFGDVSGTKYTKHYEDYITGNIIGTTNDIATYYMGEGWRMPTSAECKELVEKCTSYKTNIDGVDGRLIVGPNGNSIFLPFSGIAWGQFDIRNYSGAENTPWCNYESIYWAGESNECYGEGLANTPSYLSAHPSKYKYFGCSVRAVTD